MEGQTGPGQPCGQRTWVLEVDPTHHPPPTLEKLEPLGPALDGDRGACVGCVRPAVWWLWLQKK